MTSVRVTDEDKAFLLRLVAMGHATSLTGAVTHVCKRMRELEAIVEQQHEREDRGGKRERVVVGDDERARLAAVSEAELGKVWVDLPCWKHAVPDPIPEGELLGELNSDLFPTEWASLLLQIEEAPGRGRLSRLDATRFLVGGWQSTKSLWQERCVAELRGLNASVKKWADSGRGVDELRKDFVASSPLLSSLFNDLLTAGTRVKENKTKTPEFKCCVFVILAAALGKVRSKGKSEIGRYLFRFWRELGASNALNDCLAVLGLSISVKRGKEHQAELIGKAARSLLQKTKQRGSSECFFASCDNVDESFNSRVAQIGSRDESLHFINSTIYRFATAVPFGLGRERLREDVLDISALFPNSETEEKVMILVAGNVNRVLEPLIGGFLFDGKPLVFRNKARAPKLESRGLLQKTEMHPLPTQNFSESNLNEFFMYEKDFLSHSTPGEKMLVVADAKTYLLMRKSQNLRDCERNQNLDCDDNDAIPVPDWFHLIVCVFLGDCTRNNFALLEEFCRIIGGSYVINKSVSKSFNDSMRVFHAFYPVALARLFQYFLSDVAKSAGINPPTMEFVDVVRRFALWMAYTTRMMNADGQPVREFQRHSRLVLVLAVYHSTWEATRSADHDSLMHILHWILPIVCQGPFSQYRSVVVDSLAYYHRASPVEQFLYKQSFTVNPTGTSFGNTPTGQNQEYLNKKTKQAKRRDPTRAVNVGAETALLQDDRDVEERLRPIFRHLHDPSEGVMEPPDAKVVLELAKRKHWAELSSAVKVDNDKGKEAKRQKPLCGMRENEDIVQKVIQRLGRAAQFGLEEREEDAGSGSDCDDDNDELE